jgi:hypothetical protein
MEASIKLHQDTVIIHCTQRSMYQDSLEDSTYSSADACVLTKSWLMTLRPASVPLNLLLTGYHVVAHGVQECLYGDWKVAWRLPVNRMRHPGTAVDIV